MKDQPPFVSSIKTSLPLLKTFIISELVVGFHLTFTFLVTTPLISCAKEDILIHKQKIVRGLVN